MGKGGGRVDPVARAGAAVRACCSASAPAAAIVLGSGLGGLAAYIEHAKRIPYGDLPGLALPSVRGHVGELVHGMLNGREVLCLAGRSHLYEGIASDRSAMPIRIAHAVGARILVVTNAAGGIRGDLAPGDLMLIRDHLNMMWRNPLLGAGSAPSGIPRAVCGDCYDPALAEQMRAAAASAKLALAEGIYAAVQGPSYETPSEVRMLAALGADAVGMSTVPEVLVARSLGMTVVGVSCISNAASGRSTGKLSHAEVLAATRAAGPRFERLICAFVSRLAPPIRTGTTGERPVA